MSSGTLWEETAPVKLANGFSFLLEFTLSFLKPEGKCNTYGLSKNKSKRYFYTDFIVILTNITRKDFKKPSLVKLHGVFLPLCTLVAS